MEDWIIKASPEDRLRGFVGRMQDAVKEYFTTKRRLEQPRRGLARLIQGAVGRLQSYVARAKLREDIRYLIVQAHVDAATSALGRPLDALDMPAVRAIVNRELAAAEGFIYAIDGMEEKDALHRAALYQYAVEQTRSIMGAIEIPIALPIMPGDRRLACKGFCRCHLDITKLAGEGNFDVIWVMNPEAEHCEDCRQLAQEWTPLKIRKGVIVSIKAVSTHDRNVYEILGRELGTTVEIKEEVHASLV